MGIVWAAFSALRSRFFVCALLRQKELHSGRAARNRGTRFIDSKWK